MQIPHVQREMMRIIGYSLEQGVSGFRMDAVHFLIEGQGHRVKPRQGYEMLQRDADFLQWRRRDAVLLAGANVRPTKTWSCWASAATGCR